MARRIALDQNERAGLLALREVDPDAEQWVAPWASGVDLGEHGADLAATTYSGGIAVFRRLATRKLVDGEPGVRGEHRGYSLNDKGREALAQIDAEAT
ncbi:MAG: hypothetical protein QOF36_2603 [Microbacteriaceae bacterium]|nr:hypothetical protein [Microbacteriaceae bacterium]